VTFSIDIPDLLPLALQLTRPDEGGRPSQPQAVLEQRRLGEPVLHQVLSRRAEFLVVCRIENERRP